jgi:hypothetical protein
MHPESEAARAVISELHMPRVRTFLDSIVWKEYSIKTRKKHMSLGSRCSTAVSNPKQLFELQYRVNHRALAGRKSQPL